MCSIFSVIILPSFLFDLLNMGLIKEHRKGRNITGNIRVTDMRINLSSIFHNSFIPDTNKN